MCWNFEEGMYGGASGFKGLAYVCKSDKDTRDFLTESTEAGELIDSGTRFGLINVKGQVVLPVEYEAIAGLGAVCFPLDVIWWVRKNGLYGAINEKAQSLYPSNIQI
jgi:hypothetical protein